MARSAKSTWVPPPSRGIIHFKMEINEVVTTDQAKLVGIDYRKCRFEEETTSNHSYPRRKYTQNLCLMECGVDTAMKLCGCRPFFYRLGK